jgi:hypothetical protein
MEASRGVAERRGLRSAFVGALMGLALMVAPSGASAVVADAGCPGPADALPLVPTGDRREAQTFTALTTGALQRVSVTINNISAGDPNFLVQILPTDGSGGPVNDALASATVANTSVPAGGATLDASFSPAALVTAGHQYAVAVSRPGANFIIPTWQIQTRTPPACPGTSFFSSGATAGWAQEPTNVDIIFQTFVDPLQVTAPGRSGGAGFSLVSKHGRLFARVPGPGRLVVDDANGPRRHSRAAKHRDLVKRTKARARRAGDVPLRIELTNKGIRLAIRRQKLNILAGVTYTPTGGQPSTLTFRIRIRL